MEIRDTDNNGIIQSVINNIINSLSIKINNKDTNIEKDCFVLISTKGEKKGNVYKVKNIKGKNCFRMEFLKNLKNLMLLLM